MYTVSIQCYHMQRVKPLLLSSQYVLNTMLYPTAYAYPDPGEVRSNEPV